MASRDEAARSANDRLKGIESWARRTFIAAAIAAACAGLILLMVGYVWLDYYRARSAAAAAIEEAQARFSAGSKPAQPEAGGLKFDPARAARDFRNQFTGRAPGK